MHSIKNWIPPIYLAHNIHKIKVYHTTCQFFWQDITWPNKNFPENSHWHTSRKVTCIILYALIAMHMSISSTLLYTCKIILNRTKDKRNISTFFKSGLHHYFSWKRDLKVVHSLCEYALLITQPVHINY